MDLLGLPENVTTLTGDHLNISILNETNQWLAAAKPAALSVHNNPGEDLLSFINKQTGSELFPINRLDLGTSGIVLFGKSKSAAAKLGELMSSREVEKHYRALCLGIPKGGDSGIWNLSLSKKAEGRKNPRGITQDRVPCETHWKTLNQNKTHCLLDITLVTGRKHQIRRHSALAKCPLWGDSRYGKGKASQRLGLHAFSLEFKDPFSESDVFIECPLPQDFLELLSF